MRKPRDFDAELKVLNDKAKLLKDRKLIQLGELVIATGADALPVEQVAGALIAAAETKDVAVTEGWRRRGAAFFQHSRKTVGNAGSNAFGATPNDQGAPAASGKEGTK